MAENAIERIIDAISYAIKEPAAASDAVHFLGWVMIVAALATFALVRAYLL